MTCLGFCSCGGCLVVDQSSWVVCEECSKRVMTFDEYRQRCVDEAMQNLREQLAK